jgi:hypothetical protein
MHPAWAVLLRRHVNLIRDRFIVAERWTVPRDAGRNRPCNTALLVRRGYSRPLIFRGFGPPGKIVSEAQERLL